MLLGRTGGSGHDQQLVAALSWQRGCFWPSPAPLRLLSRAVFVSRRQTSALLEAQLLVPALSFLWDHLVQGTAVLPGAALLEIAAAASHLLSSSSDQRAAHNSNSLLLLRHSSIPAPVVLSGIAMSMRLQAEVQHADGGLTVRSIHAKSVHLTSRISQCAESAVERQPSSDSTAAAPSSRLELLLRSSPGLQPYQTASLAADHVWHTDGFLCHPAVVDSCLHLGASLAQPSISGSAPPMRVPVGLQALMAGNGFQPAAALELRGACKLHSMPTEQGPALSSYQIWQAASGSSTAVTVALAGLEARPIRLPTTGKAQLFPAAAVAAADAASGTQPQEDAQLLYHVRWEAFTPSGELGRAASCQSQPAMLTVAKNSTPVNLQLSSGLKAAQPAPLLSGLLAALQQAANQGLSGADVALATHGAMQGGNSMPAPSQGAVGAAAWGMLRVAASEVPHASWAAVDSDWHAACRHSAPAVDVAGTLERGRTTLRPMLLPAPQHSATSGGLELLVPLAGRVLVTGGLGGEHSAILSCDSSMTWGERRTQLHMCRCTLAAAGIGTLLASWLASQPGVQPVLLGRSGCFSSTLPDLLLADAPVEAVRCDAAVAAEAAAALAASAEGQLSAVLHAGGVLQDGVLRQQTAASLRVVCGPKLGFLRHAVVAGQLQPLGAVNLLSSVSAFVGSPGQANYAAANAALDCWAAALQQHGTPGKWGSIWLVHCTLASRTVRPSTICSCLHPCRRQ